MRLDHSRMNSLRNQYGMLQEPTYRRALSTYYLKRTFVQVTFMGAAIAARVTLLGWQGHGSFLLHEQRLSHFGRGLTGFVVPRSYAGLPVLNVPAQSDFI